MLFFQIGLLLGYAYAHFISNFFGPKKQVKIHFILLGFSLLLLPITPNEAYKPVDANSPVLNILWLLFSSVGIPYILISSTGPLLQNWFAKKYPTKSPYRLYALSNLGSLLGLLTYPFIIEPNLGLNIQSIGWSYGYGVAAFCCGWAGLVLIKSYKENNDLPDQPVSDKTSPSKVNVLDPFLWIALSACGSTVLLAATNFICQDVAVIPFLWILPLSLYLITFIIAFDNPRWYVRSLWIPGLILIVPRVLTLLESHYDLDSIDLVEQMVTYLGAMFLATMVCHGEMVRLKPPKARLTFFYMMVSIGGALGGCFVTIVAPRIFSDFWEWPIGLSLAVFLAAISFIRKPDLKFPIHKVNILLTSPVSSRILTITLGILMASMALSYGKRIPSLVDSFSEGVLDSNRNFYGVLRIIESSKGTTRHRLKLYHGQINHGIQFQDPDMMNEHTTYYSRHSGVGLAIRRHPKRLAEQGLRLGIVGLGSGTIATYFKSQDQFVYYEIDPDVERLSRQHFTYLNDIGENLEVVLGDGRISLEREYKTKGARNFDVLAIDAFSGDAIPIHLLTHEAFEVYFKHLNPAGVLAIHISNIHFNLDPLIYNMAKEFKMDSILIEESSDSSIGVKGSSWVLISKNQDFLQHERVIPYITPWSDEIKEFEIIWTDDYSNVVKLLKKPLW